MFLVAHSARAGIPGVAGRLGVPAKAINLLEEGIFVSRVSAIFLGVSFAFWGCICALGFFSFVRAPARFFGGSYFFKAYHTKTGNSRSGRRSTTPLHWEVVPANRQRPQASKKKNRDAKKTPERSVRCCRPSSKCAFTHHHRSSILPKMAALCCVRVFS